MDLTLRHALVWIQRASLELDRLVDSEAIAHRLWTLARDLGLRTMRLREQGAALQADAAEGFEAFATDGAAALPRMVAPYEPDGLFAAVAAERAVFSGPRPAQGFPVDLVLSMGRERPAWCLLIPLPARHRWSRFLYVDATSAQLEEILKLDPVARLAVTQLRAARLEPHRPAVRVRAHQEAALRQRLARPAGPAGEEGEASPPSGVDRFSRKPRRPRRAFAPPSPERFDGEGRLIQPLPPAEIESRVGALPELPPTAALVLSLLEDPETTVPALDEVITQDADLVHRFLRIANSSQFGAMRECRAVSEAIVRLGFSTIRSWLLASATRQLFLPQDGVGPQRVLWQQSVVTAVAAQRLAELTQAADPEIAFLGGLLQNVGLLLLARDHREVYEEIQARAADEERPVLEVERTCLGFDHADLSAALLARWVLPGEVVDAVRTHHRLDEIDEEHRPLAALVALAETLAEGVVARESAGEDLESTEAIFLGLAPEDVAAVKRGLEPMLVDQDLLG